MRARLPLSPEADDLAVVERFQLPLGDLLSGTRHSSQHDTDGKNNLQFSPDDVHVVALDGVFGHLAHVNREAPPHAHSPQAVDSATCFDRGSKLSPRLTTPGSNPRSSKIIHVSSTRPNAVTGAQ